LKSLRRDWQGITTGSSSPLSLDSSMLRESQKDWWDLELIGRGAVSSWEELLPLTG
jgi:hypothetical protein